MLPPQVMGYITSHMSQQQDTQQMTHITHTIDYSQQCFIHDLALLHNTLLSNSTSSLEGEKQTQQMYKRIKK